jgi:energy-coupling factor transport system substrate-specific component
MNKILSSAKELANIALMSALLLSGQLALSQIGGIEIVTVLLLCYSYVYGAKRGICVALIFCLLRNFIYGFYVTVIILYFIYYPLFALFWGTVGKRFTNIGAITLIATLCTLIFSCLDNLITPIFYFVSPTTPWNFRATYLYWIASAPFALTQCVSTVVTVALLFKPLTKVFSCINKAN